MQLSSLERNPLLLATVMVKLTSLSLQILSDSPVFLCLATSHTSSSSQGTVHADFQRRFPKLSFFLTFACLGHVGVYMFMCMQLHINTHMHYTHTRITHT